MSYIWSEHKGKNRMKNRLDIWKTESAYTNLEMHAYQEAMCLHYSQEEKESSYINVNIKMQKQNNRDDVGILIWFGIQRYNCTGIQATCANTYKIV